MYKVVERSFYTPTTVVVNAESDVVHNSCDKSSSTVACVRDCEFQCNVDSVEKTTGLRFIYIQYMDIL